MCPRPRVFRDLPGQFPGIDRLSAMLGEEELAGHRGPHARPVFSLQRRSHRQARRGIDRRDPSGHFEPERADDTMDDLEWSSKIARVLIVAWGEVWPFQLLLAELGQRVQTAAEQRACSAVTGSPTASPSIPFVPEPIHTPGVSPRSV